ncbi:MAG: FtsX-like permease family protein, partial [Chitinophagaceae bacterium]
VNAMNSQVILAPLKKWHLYGKYENGKIAGGYIEYVRMFTIIGLLVLLIACINFINLTTARSEKRAREVGVRKAIGSLRKDLIIQFLTESFLLTCLSFILSLIFVFLALPAFNQLTERDIHLPLSNGIFWLVMIGCIVITALLAGSRPAFYLSSFQPVRVLKGSFRAGKSASLPRKILVVLQFTCSIALIISTVIIYQQVQHARNRPMGYEVNRVIVSNSNDDLNKNYSALKNELLQNNIVSSFTHSSSPATNVYWHSDVEEFPGKQPGETVEMGIVITGADYFKTLGMSIIQGRNFTGEFDSTSVIMNESAVKLLRLKEPLNQQLDFQGSKVTVAGVVKDALMISPFDAADPTMFFCSARPQGNFIYQLSPGIPTERAMTKLTEVFNKYNPAFPYNYQFADDDYATKFKLEVLIGKLAGIFAVLAILISCLGLFGLAAYIAEQRTKEIGVRKVLGASIGQVWSLLSKDFIVLVLISCCIASPLAFYFLNNWLQDYDYRITIDISVFVFSAVAAILITITTISFQAIRAAVANPVKSLRTE